MHKHEAIRQLNSTVVTVNESYDADTDTTTITCTDVNGNEVTIDLDAVNSLVASKEYRDNRKNEYPPIGDQLDDLFKAGAFSTEMTATLQAVKDKYPKE